MSKYSIAHIAKGAMCGVLKQRHADHVIMHQMCPVYTLALSLLLFFFMDVLIAIFVFMDI